MFMLPVQYFFINDRVCFMFLFLVRKIYAGIECSHGLWDIRSLRSKRFCGVGEQRKTKERDFVRAKLGREPNKKERVG